MGLKLLTGFGLLTIVLLGFADRGFAAAKSDNVDRPCCNRAEHDCRDASGSLLQPCGDSNKPDTIVVQAPGDAPLAKPGDSGEGK